jgi:hypothetical protein
MGNIGRKSQTKRPVSRILRSAKFVFLVDYLHRLPAAERNWFAFFKLNGFIAGFAIDGTVFLDNLGFVFTGHFSLQEL